MYSISFIRMVITRTKKGQRTKKKKNTHIVLYCTSVSQSLLAKEECFHENASAFLQVKNRKKLK